MKAALAVLISSLLAAPAWAQSADAGACFALVFVPPAYATESEQVLKTAATERIRTIPARYEWTEEQVKVPAGRVAVTVTPAEYEVTEERVQIAPAQEKTVKIPAVYKTVKEKVVTRTGSVTKLGNAAPGSGQNGAILCTVEEPIEYRWVERKVLVTPARTEKVQVPAQFKTVKHRKRLKPAEVRWVDARERTRTRRVKVLAEPAREERVPVPAVYETVNKQVLKTAARSEWREVLCESNVTAELIRDVQRKLVQTGHYRGRIDGRLNAATQAAVKRYQASAGLSETGMDVETLKRLGLRT